jgi:ethanolamine utilization protein EutM
MLETKGLVVLVQATDAMLKAANVKLVGWRKVGSGYCSCYITGEVAAVKAAIEVGTAAAREIGELVAAEVLPRPHDDLMLVIS